MQYNIVLYNFSSKTVLSFDQSRLEVSFQLNCKHELLKPGSHPPKKLFLFVSMEAL